MIKAYKNFWKLALKSEGKSSRSDYWWTFLINSLIRAIIVLIDFIIILGEFMKRMTGTTTPDQVQRVTQDVLSNLPSSALMVQVVGIAFSLVIMLPVTTLTARRLRDAGYAPGLAYPLPAIYLANAVVLFVDISGLSAVTLFASVYTFILLILCTRASSDLEKVGKI